MKTDDYPLERGNFERTLCKALDRAGFDTYGTIIDERLRRFVNADGLSAQVQLVRIGNYEIMPYFWGDDELHPDVAAHPNFSDHENNLHIWWYKYALRGASANRPVTLDEWVHIMMKFASYVESRLEGIPPL